MLPERSSARRNSKSKNGKSGGSSARHAASSTCSMQENRSTRISCRRLIGLRRLVMKHEELTSCQGERGVGSALIVRKLDLEDAGGQRLHDRADLPPVQATFRQILGQGHHVQDVYRVLHLS